MGHDWCDDGGGRLVVASARAGCRPPGPVRKSRAFHQWGRPPAGGDNRPADRLDLAAPGRLHHVVFTSHHRDSKAGPSGVGVPASREKHGAGIDTGDFLERLPGCRCGRIIRAHASTRRYIRTSTPQVCVRSFGRGADQRVAYRPGAATGRAALCLRRWLVGYPPSTH